LECIIRFRYVGWDLLSACSDIADLLDGIAVAAGAKDEEDDCGRDKVFGLRGASPGVLERLTA
jgi:hypothetical protein